MKLAVVTSSEYSFASLLLSETWPINVKPILILNKARSRSMNRFFKKIIKIGPIGALFGYLSRKWYKLEYDSVVRIAQHKNIAVYYVTNFRPSTVLKNILSDYDIGISMGNGYIPRQFFTIFKYGMINIHHEVLPQFAGAQSVLWPLIERKSETGYSIHFISEKIDKGDIVVCEKRPIVYKSSLGKTVWHNYSISVRMSVNATMKLIRMPITEWKRVNNDNETVFTTPTFTNWIRAYKNFNQLKNKNGTI